MKMSKIDELCQELFEEIFRDKIRRALEDDAPAIKELEKLAQQINRVLDKKSYYDGNREHAVGTVILRDGVTKIEDRAFKDCTRLEKVILPDSVTEIGKNAFWGCSGLKEINIPSGVTEIGTDAFFCCGGLKEINIPSGVTYIGNSAFLWCSGLKEINIPSSVVEIGKNAFWGCSGLKKISYYRELEPSLKKEFGAKWDNLEKIVLD